MNPTIPPEWLIEALKEVYKGGWADGLLEKKMYIDHPEYSATLIHNRFQQSLGADDKLSLAEADGKCEDIPTNINAYIKEAKNSLRNGITNAWNRDK